MQVADNAVEVATPQETTEVTQENTVVETPEITQTQAFSKRLKEEQERIRQEHQQEVNQFAQKLGYNDFSELQQAQYERELEDQAAANNIPPDVYRRLMEMESKSSQLEKEVSTYKQEKQLKDQDEQMAKDPDLGEFYKENRAEILDTAKKFNVDIDTALTLTSRMKLKDILVKSKSIDMEEIKKTAVKEYFDNLKADKKPIEGSGASPVIVNTPAKSWEEARKNSMAFLKTQKLF